MRMIASRLSIAGLLAAQFPGTALAADEAFKFFEEEAQVIAAEEIRDSGAVNVWDLLRYRAGGVNLSFGGGR